MELARGLVPAPKGPPRIARRFNAGKTRQRHKSRRDGRVSSIPKVSLVVFDTVLHQQRQKLLLKARLPMMFLLVLDVMNDFEFISSFVTDAKEIQINMKVFRCAHLEIQLRATDPTR